MPRRMSLSFVTVGSSVGNFYVCILIIAFLGYITGSDISGSRSVHLNSVLLCDGKILCSVQPCINAHSPSLMTMGWQVVQGVPWECLGFLR